MSAYRLLCDEAKSFAPLCAIRKVCMEIYLIKCHVTCFGAECVNKPMKEISK